VQGPNYKVEKLRIEGSNMEYEIPIIQVWDPNTLMINEQRLSEMTEVIAPTEINSTTFQGQQ
jgi:hypothetical protein